METKFTITAANKLDLIVNKFIKRNSKNPVVFIKTIIKLDNTLGAKFLASKYNFKADGNCYICSLTANEILDLQQESCVISITAL